MKYILKLTLLSLLTFVIGTSQCATSRFVGMATLKKLSRPCYSQLGLRLAVAKQQPSRNMETLHVVALTASIAASTLICRSYLSTITPIEVLSTIGRTEKVLNFFRIKSKRQVNEELAKIEEELATAKQKQMDLFITEVEDAKTPEDIVKTLALFSEISYHEQENHAKIQELKKWILSRLI